MFGEAADAQHEQDLNEPCDEDDEGRGQQDGHHLVQEALVDDQHAAPGVDELAQGRDGVLLVEVEALAAVLGLDDAAGVRD